MRAADRTGTIERPGRRGTADFFPEAAEATRGKQGRRAGAVLPKAALSWWGTVFLLLACVCAPASANAGQRPGLGGAAVTGRVVSADAGFLPPVDVQLQISTGRLVETTQTDGSGRFSFHGVQPGSYALVIRIPGYRSFNLPVIVGNGPVIGLELVLMPEGFRRGSGGTGPGGTGIVSVRQLLIPGKAREEFRKGSRSRARGKADEAIKHWRKSIEIYPKYAESYMELSRVYADRGEFDRARIAAEHAVEIDGDSADPYTYLGYVYLKEKKFPKAERAFRIAVRHSGDDWFSQFWLGELLLMQRKPKDAYPHLLRASVLNPRAPQVFVFLYDDLLLLGRRREALKTLDDFLARFPNNPLAGEVREKRKALVRSLAGGEK